jgi:1,2-diacylglycerol 3-beta-galactosyltransferase
MLIMDNLPVQPWKILFLFSDTGGGHRSATEAIIEALHLEYGDRVNAKMVDVFREYAPRPLNQMPRWYPEMVRIPELWGLGYRLSDGQRRASILNHSMWPYVRRSIRLMVTHHPADMVVSVHPLTNTPALRALGNSRPPFITVVTDLVTAHAFWYDRRADLCVVPTAEARQRALGYGLDPGKVKVAGLPVADRFCQPIGDRQALRADLGWPQDRPVVLLMGGGDGMGPLESIAMTFAAAKLPITLAIVTGRNARLKTRLETRSWPMPVFIYGFVREMPDMMRAADILVTKAGPGTICEALIAGLPIVLYTRLPGQEDGNIHYITDHGAGIWAPRRTQTLAAVRHWLENPAAHATARAACLRLARPQAAREIAQILVHKIQETRPDPNYLNVEK